jgi:predicted nucleic acid-binding protein
VTEPPVLLDSDTLSELSRGQPRVTARAREYLARHGRLTISAVSVFERLRGYRCAIAAGRPYSDQMQKFRVFAATCRVLAVDAAVAEHAAGIWAGLPARARSAIGDILIAATAVGHGLALVTRNRRDFGRMASLDGIRLELTDWTRQ